MHLHPSFVLPVMPGDTPIGYASKVALGIGRNLRLFVRDIGSDFQALVDGDAAAVEQLRRVCGLASNTFSDSTLLSLPGRRYSVAGQQFLMDQVQREYLRVCLCCIDEQMSGPRGVLSVGANAHWHLLPLYACPKHHVPIATAKAINGSRRHAHDFAWRLREALRSCSFQDADKRGAKPSGLANYVLATLRGEADDHWLSCMPLYAAIKIAQMVGAETMGINERRWGGMSHATLHEVGGVGFDVLREGEAGLRKIFADAQRKYFAKHSFSGKLSMFGRLYRFLAEDSDDPAFEPAREVLRRHIIEEMPVGPEDTALGKPVPCRLIHSVRTIAPELGLNTVTAGRRLVRVGILDSSTEHLSPDQRTFEVAKHASLLARLKTALLRGDAGRYLGIPRIFPGVDTVLEMAGSLNIEKTPTTQQLYAKDDLDRFLATFRDKANTSASAEGFELIAAAASKAKTSIVSILELIRDNRLDDIRVSTEHHGIMALMVSPQDVRAGLLGKRTWVTRIEAKNMLQVSQATLAELVQRDLLPASKTHGIEREDLASFKRRYITMTEIHRTYRPLRENHGSRWTPYSEITDAGVVPVIDRRRYPIYLRDEVTSVLGPPLAPAS